MIGFLVPRCLYSSQRFWAPIILFIVRVIIGGLFVWSGISKMQSPFDFLSSVYDYELLSPTGGLLVATILPTMEIVIGILLLAEISLCPAFLISVFLSFIFVLVQISVIQREMDISCGCFDSDNIYSTSNFITYATVIRTSVLLVASISGLALSYLFSSKNP